MHIHDMFKEKAEEGDGLFAIAYALMELADAHDTLARNIRFLGNGDASTRFGALEAFGMHIGRKLDALTEALGGTADPGLTE